MASSSHLHQVANALFDTSPIHYHHHRLLSMEDEPNTETESQSTAQLQSNDPDNHIRQQMHEPESEDIHTNDNINPNTPNKPNTDRTLSSNQNSPQIQDNSNSEQSHQLKQAKPEEKPINDDINNVNDLDDILEQQMEDASVQRQQAIEIQIKAQNHEYNILKLYIFIIV